MKSHFVLLAVFAFFVSSVFAALMREEAGEQLRFGVRLFAGFVLGGVVLGWLLYPLPF